VYLSQGKLPLNENESKYLIELIEEGIKNIGENKIKMIVIDRGFLSGENLWDVKRRFGIDFLIYSKSNMPANLDEGDITKELKNKKKEYERMKKENVPIPKDYFYQTDEQIDVYGFNKLKWLGSYGDKLHKEKMKKKLYKKNI